MKIRFLTLTPQEFAEGPANSHLLSQAEKFSLLMNICSPSAGNPMPDGFSRSNFPRKRKQPLNLRQNAFMMVSKIQGKQQFARIFWIS